MTEVPKRIQRKRTKGWKMPENTVYVGRPTRWGNPFHHHGDGYPMDPALAVDSFRRMLHRGGFIAEGQSIATTAAAVKMLLRGKNLACWCPLIKPCHADVLLELANPDIHHQNIDQFIGGAK